jgi:hypothetical protein
MLPSSVKVGAHRVPIVYKESIEGDDEENLHCGMFYVEDFRIEISSRMRNSRIAEILLHEVLHAINASYGFINQDEEERAVTTLAAAFTKLAQDNPEFIQQWLHHACKE